MAWLASTFNVFVLTAITRSMSHELRTTTNSSSEQSILPILGSMSGTLSGMTRTRTIEIKDNAVIGSGFPTGGPYVRDGMPPLADGEHEIVEGPDGVWHLRNDRNFEVLRPVHDRRQHAILDGSAVIDEALERIKSTSQYAQIRAEVTDASRLDALLREMARETLAGLRHAIVVERKRLADG